MFVMEACVVVSICTNVILSVAKVCSHLTHANGAIDIDITGPLEYESQTL